MKKIIIFISIVFIASSCISNKILINLHTLPKAKREKYLLAQAKETVLKYGPGYYREYKTPIIEEDVISASDTINAIEGLSRELGRHYYKITFMYDTTREQLEWDYAAVVHIWEDTGKPSGVSFGNGYGRILYGYETDTDNLGAVPYQQAAVFPLYDWQNGKDETNSEPINKDELIKRGYEKQSDGTWIKVKPDIPPKY
jgi:hypothetical protein